jgi:Domain of unknown function (DUF1737)
MKREYIVVEQNSATALTDRVEQLLIEGWSLIGGVSLVQWTQSDHEGYTNQYWNYAQAMVREVKEQS